jgi:hypothetical protein
MRPRGQGTFNWYVVKTQGVSITGELAGDLPHRRETGCAIFTMMWVWQGQWFPQSLAQGAEATLAQSRCVPAPGVRCPMLSYP